MKFKKQRRQWYLLLMTKIKKSVSASTEFGYPNSGDAAAALPQQATHLDIQMQPLVRHLLGQIPKTL